MLVNNVRAVRIRLGGFFGTTDEDFAWAMQMNFFIALRASRAALAAMVERNDRHGRFTTREEVATLITLLASERTGNVTGANYIIDAASSRRARQATSR